MRCSLTNAGIPSSLTQLSHLKAIGLKKNNLSRVPPVLGSMHSLQEIYLENNPTLEVSTDAQPGCPGANVQNRQLL